MNPNFLDRLSVLWNPVNPFQQTSEKELQAAAYVLKLKVLSLPARSPAEIESAFATIKRERPHALLVLADRLSALATLWRFMADQTTARASQPADESHAGHRQPAEFVLPVKLQRLLDYWRSKRIGREMPRRDEIDPSDIPALLRSYPCSR